MRISKLTNEGFITKLAERNQFYANGDITVCEEYKGCKEKLKCRCNLCGSIFYATPDNLYRGSITCRHCSIDMVRQQRTHSNDLFLKELYDVNKYYRDGNLLILQKYEGSKKKLKCHCNIHNEDFYTTPTSLKKGRSCRRCGSDSCWEKRGINHKKFLQNLHDKNERFRSGEFLVLNEYTRAIDNAECFCTIHNENFSKTFNELLNGSGCPKCGVNIRANMHKDQSATDFLDRLKASNRHYYNGDFILLSDYNGTKNRITCKCCIDGHIWDALPSNLLKGKGCPICGGKQRGIKRRMSPYEFIEKLFAKNIHYRNGEFRVISDISNIDDGESLTSRKIWCQCNFDHNKWSSTGGNLLNGRGCPFCSRSIGESKIIEYLNAKQIDFKYQHSFDDLFGYGGGKLRYDFFVTEYNLLIEFNGEQHYAPRDFFGGDKQFETQVAYDDLKREYAKSCQINMLTIGYWDMDNIENILSNVFFDQEYCGVVEYDNNAADVA